MEIHAPHGPVPSFREALIHIAIVTVGILIALGLEGVREMIHDHTLVSEAVEHFRLEMKENKENLALEIRGLKGARENLDKILADLPALEQHPEQLPARLQAVLTPGYYMLDAAWGTALSTGALAHMHTEDVAYLGELSKVQQIYTRQQEAVMPAEFEIKAYALTARLNALQVADCEHKLREMRARVGLLESNAANYLKAVEKVAASMK